MEMIIIFLEVNYEPQSTEVHNDINVPFFLQTLILNVKIFRKVTTILEVKTTIL